MASFSTISRLVALGGLTVLSGTSYALYNAEKSLNNADCSPLTVHDNERVLIPSLKKKLWDDNWDLLDKGSAIANVNLDKELDSETPKPTATRHIILVRHGQYVQDSSDDKLRILTDIGRQQATFTGERLKFLDYKFDKVTVSTMTRAQETCDLIKVSFPDMEEDKCSLLREGAPYPVEPESTVWKPEERQFFEDNPRIEAAFRKYIHRADPKQKEDSYELLVCHGNVIRYFVCRALQFPPEGWLRMAVANCGITWLAVRPNGRVSLRALGDVGHLPPGLITYN